MQAEHPDTMANVVIRGDSTGSTYYQAISPGSPGPANPMNLAAAHFQRRCSSRIRIRMRKYLFSHAVTMPSVCLCPSSPVPHLASVSP